MRFSIHINLKLTNLFDLKFKNLGKQLKTSVQYNFLKLVKPLKYLKLNKINFN